MISAARLNLVILTRGAERFLGQSTPLVLRSSNSWDKQKLVHIPSDSSLHSDARSIHTWRDNSRARSGISAAGSFEVPSSSFARNPNVPNALKHINLKLNHFYTTTNDEAASEAATTFRSKNRFNRRPNGGVQLVDKEGKTWDVKLDMQVAGALLLRNAVSDEVYYIVADNFKQIDLSNDHVVSALFRDGAWEEARAPLLYGSGGHVRIAGPQFDALITLLTEGPGATPQV